VQSEICQATYNNTFKAAYQNVLCHIIQRDSTISGSLSPRHGVPSCCGWWNRLQYGV